MFCNYLTWLLSLTNRSKYNRALTEATAAAAPSTDQLHVGSMAHEPVAMAGGTGSTVQQCAGNGEVMEPAAGQQHVSSSLQQSTTSEHSAAANGKPAAAVIGMAQSNPEVQQQAHKDSKPVMSSEELEALQQRGQQYNHQQLLKVLHRVDKHIGDIHQSLPVNAMLIVATGQGDMAECRRQQEIKYRRQGGLQQPPWTTTDEEAFNTLLEREMKALCFCVVKQSCLD